MRVLSFFLTLWYTCFTSKLTISDYVVFQFGNTHTNSVDRVCTKYEITRDELELPLTISASIKCEIDSRPARVTTTVAVEGHVTLHALNVSSS